MQNYLFILLKSDPRNFTKRHEKVFREISCISSVVFVSWLRSRGILRRMRRLHLLILAGCCLFVFSCTSHDTMQSGTPASSPPPVQSPTPAHDDVAGGFAAPEPGESPSAEFKGTIGLSEKKRAGAEPALLRVVRTGKHESFDRVVFEFEGSAIPGYHIEYVDKPVRDCGQGAVVPISGDGFLLIRMQPSNAHTEAGVPSVTARQQSPKLPILKELKLICDFEADVQWILGVSSPNRYRVLELTNPARLVVDIAHKPGGQ
jgi:hypothetical protein